MGATASAPAATGGSPTPPDQGDVTEAVLEKGRLSPAPARGAQTFSNLPGHRMTIARIGRRPAWSATSRPSLSRTPPAPHAGEHHAPGYGPLAGAEGIRPVRTEPAGLPGAGGAARHLAGRGPGRGHPVRRRVPADVARRRAAGPLVLVQGGVDRRRPSDLAVGPSAATEYPPSQQGHRRPGTPGAPRQPRTHHGVGHPALLRFSGALVPVPSARDIPRPQDPACRRQA